MVGLFEWTNLSEMMMMMVVVVMMVMVIDMSATNLDLELGCQSPVNAVVNL